MFSQVETQLGAKFLVENGRKLFQAKTYNEAFCKFQMAAKMGNPQAEYEVGFCLLAGLGVEADGMKAFHWFHQAAKHGNGKAMNLMGVFYTEGWDSWLEIDFTEAYKFFKLGEKHGDKNAPNWLKLVKLWMTPEDIAEAENRVREFQISHRLSSNVVIP